MLATEINCLVLGSVISLQSHVSIEIHERSERATTYLMTVQLLTPRFC